MTDFASTWVVVGDAATAAGLTAFGFVVGPFVYLGHEKAWDLFVGRRAGAGLIRATSLDRHP